jgi:DNA-directed RNA polymerase subunit RPC12/RpoP
MGCDEIEIAITCPVCEKEFKKMARDMPDGAVIKCPGCGEKTTIKGNMFSKMVKSLDEGFTA